MFNYKEQRNNSLRLLEKFIVKEFILKSVKVINKRLETLYSFQISRGKNGYRNFIKIKWETRRKLGKQPHEYIKRFMTKLLWDSKLLGKNLINVLVLSVSI